MLDWLRSGLRHIALPDRAPAYDTTLALKPISELVLTADVLLRLGAWEDEAKALLEWGWRQVDDGRALARLLITRPDLFGVMQLVASFSAWGFRSAGARRAVMGAFSLVSTRSHELPAWRRFATRRNMERLGLRDWDSQDFESTWIGALPEPWFAPLEMVYAVTHEVFYATAFGERPERVPVTVQDYLDLWLPVWCAMYWEDTNLDVVAELAMTAWCLDLPEIAHEITSLVVRSLTPAGFVAGPEGAGRKFMRGTDEPERTVFVSHYHTTATSLMAVAMSLHRSRS